MPYSVMILAPHADDETFGVGGTIRKRILNGNKVGLVLFSDHAGSQSRKNIIDEMMRYYGINPEDFFYLDLRPATLDQLPIKSLVERLSLIFKKFEPSQIFIPSRFDAHTDHEIVHKASLSALKWFRCESIKQILAYEVISETNFAFGKDGGFLPNWFEDISETMDDKIKIAKCYRNELAEHPFPRSIDSVTALAKLRGSQSGFQYAEAFELIYGRFE